MKKRHYWEALASFLIVGLGQIIKGEGKKGLQLMLAFYFILPALVYVSLLINAYLFLLTLAVVLICGIILWGYNVYDSFTHEAIF